MRYMHNSQRYPFFADKQCIKKYNFVFKLSKYIKNAKAKNAAIFLLNKRNFLNFYMFFFHGNIYTLPKNLYCTYNKMNRSVSS